MEKESELLPILLARKNQKTSDKEQEELVEELYKQIGELKVENEFLKKLVQASLYRREEEHDSIEFFSVHSKSNVNFLICLVLPITTSLFQNSQPIKLS